MRHYLATHWLVFALITTFASAKVVTREEHRYFELVGENSGTKTYFIGDPDRMLTEEDAADVLRIVDTCYDKNFDHELLRDVWGSLEAVYDGPLKGEILLTILKAHLTALYDRLSPTQLSNLTRDSGGGYQLWTVETEVAKGLLEFQHLECSISVRPGMRRNKKGELEPTFADRSEVNAKEQEFQQARISAVPGSAEHVLNEFYTKIGPHATVRESGTVDKLFASVINRYLQDKRPDLAGLFAQIFLPFFNSPERETEFLQLLERHGIKVDRKTEEARKSGPFDDVMEPQTPAEKKAQVTDLLSRAKAVLTNEPEMSSGPALIKAFDLAAAARRSAATNDDREAARAVIEQIVERRFVNNGDGTFLDRATGLVWAVEVTNVTYRAAKHHCENLVIAGLADWRIPSHQEIQTIQILSCSVAGVQFGVQYDRSSWWITPSYQQFDMQSKKTSGGYRDERCWLRPVRGSAVAESTWSCY